MQEQKTVAHLRGEIQQLGAIPVQSLEGAALLEEIAVYRKSVIESNDPIVLQGYISEATDLECFALLLEISVHAPLSYDYFSIFAFLKKMIDPRQEQVLLTNQQLVILARFRSEIRDKQMQSEMTFAGIREVMQ